MNLPADFTTYTQALLGNDKYAQLEQALSQPQPISIRFNDKLQEEDILPFKEQVPWCENGRYINTRLSFTFDPLFHAGCYYVQEASSMFVEQAIRQYISTPVVALDLCAAPGGKSTHLRSILPEGSLLVSNELNRTRAQVLAENMMKWGHPDIMVTSNSPSDFGHLNHAFDILLTDMPCSGEGMFRKDEGAINEWSKENVVMCAQRQKEIITDCWDCLRPGGLLIYSTCTFNTLEDEENVLWISQELGAEILLIPISEENHITGNLLKGHDFPVYRFLPGKTKGEGFFLAVLRKNGTYTSSKKKVKEDKKKKPIPVQGLRELMTKASSWLTNDNLFNLSTDGKTITATRKLHQDTITQLAKTLHIIHQGITIGEIKGHDLIPQQSLALSNYLNRDAFASQEISYEQAITYLRKESIILESSTPRGCVLLTYHHIPLGFVKNMGNRTNNLYPTEWRIRSGYLPQDLNILISR